MFYNLLNSYAQKYPFPRRGLKYVLKTMRFLNIAGKVYLKKLPGNIMMRLKPEEHIQQQLFWYGSYEKELGTVLKKLLLPKSVFIDIGANIGYFSLIASRAVPTATIIAFEPVSYLFAALQENIALNNIKNIQPVLAAVGEKNEKSLMYLSDSSNTGMSSLRQPENYSGINELTDVISLDNWFADSGLTKVDIIKIDVEGNELGVLRGMNDIANKLQPHILLELNPETLAYFGLTSTDVLTHISHLNYLPFTITESGKLKRFQENQVTKTINLVLIHRIKSDSVPELID